MFISLRPPHQLSAMRLAECTPTSTNSVGPMRPMIRAVASIAGVLQAADGANPSKVTPVQVEVRSPEARDVIARRIIAALVEPRDDLVHSSFHFVRNLFCGH
jgi:hypothetical protein